jgi:hypothetical protein
MDVQVKLSAVTAGEGRRLADVSGTLRCAVGHCPSAAISGKAGPQGAPFSFRIRAASQGRSLEGSAEDAGALLHALHIMDGLEGGALSLSGTYNDAREGRPLAGELVIRDYRARDVPLLAKLLTLASLTGFVDTLQGNGISFARLSAPFTLKRDVITLRDAKTYGPAVGLTAEGTIRFPGTRLDVKGTVVPSYTLNSFFGKVPLIGGILTGKEEGGGLIAARYALAGPPGAAQVSVNPLSILTPGFLRGLFDMLPEEKAQKPN